MDRFNRLPRQDLIAELLACLDVPRWATDIADRRPYSTPAEIHHAADAAARALTTEEVQAALAAHPRIGERPAGTGTGSTWSRTEQSGVDTEDVELERALREGNEQYEQRFGHIYLVCARGRGGPELLETLRSRLTNDPRTEQGIVADELRKIALLRLAKVIER